MATLSTTKTYSDNNLLSESDLDAFIDDIETFLNTTKLTDDNFATNGIDGALKIAQGVLTTAKLANTTVSSTQIQAGSLTSDKITDVNITTAKIAAKGIVTDNLATDAITNAKMTTNTVETAKVADDAVTQAKRSAVIYGTSSVFTDSTTSASVTAITGASVSISVSGDRPVFVGVIAADGDVSHIEVYKTDYFATGIFYLRESGTNLIAPQVSAITQNGVGTTCRLRIPVSTIGTVYIPSSSGSKTYTLSFSSTGSTTVSITNGRLVAVEL